MSVEMSLSEAFLKVQRGDTPEGEKQRAAGIVLGKLQSLARGLGQLGDEVVQGVMLTLLRAPQLAERHLRDQLDKTGRGDTSALRGLVEAASLRGLRPEHIAPILGERLSVAQVDDAWSLGLARVTDALAAATLSTMVRRRHLDWVRRAQRQPEEPLIDDEGRTVALPGGVPPDLDSQRRSIEARIAAARTLLLERIIPAVVAARRAAHQPKLKLDFERMLESGARRETIPALVRRLEPALEGAARTREIGRLTRRFSRARGDLFFAIYWRWNTGEGDPELLLLAWLLAEQLFRRNEVSGRGRPAVSEMNPETSIEEGGSER